ncbi:MAG: tetratricopeptide repeat protein [Acidobacteria bacterium]|nr:tetratricopeptide repeat protein [Acidobacteriota bacterium]
MIRVLAPFFFALTIVAAAAETYLVVPFSNRAKDPKMDWLGESISEAIRESGEAAAIEVVSREDREDAVKKLSLRPSAQMPLASAVKLAESTASSRAVYGTFELLPAEAKAQVPSKGSLRITGRVFDLKRIAQVGEASITGAIEDLPGLQAELSWQLWRQVHGPLKVRQEDNLKHYRAAKAAALENYIRGLISSSKWLQHRYLTQAARLDPGFPHPHFYLGRMQWWEEHYREAASWLQKVPEDFIYYQEASFMLAMSKYELSDFHGARQALERIEARLPIPEVWNNIAAAHNRLNQPTQALPLFRKALEADPADTDYQFNVGYALWKLRDFANAAERFRAVLDRSPDDQDAILLLGRCLAASGPRPGDLRGDGLERVKDSYTEPAGPGAWPVAVK